MKKASSVCVYYCCTHYKAAFGTRVGSNLAYRCSADDEFFQVLQRRLERGARMIVVQGIVGGGKNKPGYGLIIMGQMSHDAQKTGNYMVLLKTCGGVTVCVVKTQTLHSRA
jgi:hypothetical protein